MLFLDSCIKTLYSAHRIVTTLIHMKPSCSTHKDCTTLVCFPEFKISSEITAFDLRVFPTDFRKVRVPIILTVKI